MRKLLYSFLFFIFLHTAGFGQSASSYCFSSSTETYANLTGTTPAPGISTSSTDDAISNPIAMGFNFIFGGVSYNQLKISNNGWITFGSTNNSYYENSFANAGNARPVIFPFWDDLYHRNNLAPRYVVTGSSGNRIFKIEWIQQYFRDGNSGDVISFQVWLYEGSNRIEFRYRQGTTTPGNVISGSIGIFDANQTYITLNNAGSNPTPQTGTFTTNISARPATDQVYTFTIPVTTSNAGPDQYRTTPFTLAANTPTVGTGVWSIVSGPSTSLSQFSSTSSPTATFTPSAAGTYELSWTISNAWCNSSDQVIVSNCVDNLIKNGNFSNGSADWSAATARGAYVEVLTEGLYFGNGSNDNTAELDSEASLRQQVAVIPGVTYKISYLYARRPGSPGTVAADVRVIDGTTTTTTNYSTSAIGVPLIGTHTFTAINSSVYVELWNSLHGNSTLGSIIDNIVLVPVSQVAPMATTDPKPVFKTSTVCAGVPVQLDVENVPASGVTYAWSSPSSGVSIVPTNGKNPLVTFTGSGAKEVTVVVTNAGGCSGAPSTTYFNVNAAPTVYNVTGGGTYCASGTGLAVGLSGSATGVNYQLQLNGSDNGAVVAGTGSAIGFGLKTVAGTYTVIATNTAPNTNTCSLPMNGSVTIAVNPTSVGGTVGGSATVCTGTNTTTLTLTGHTGSVTRWESSPSSTFASAITNIPNTTTSLIATNLTTTTYYRAVVTSGICAAANSSIASVTVNPVHTISATTAVNQTVCQNSAMSNITFTLGGGATNATVNNLPPGVSYSVSGNTLTISGTPTVIDVYSYSITTTGNSCTAATASGTIIVGIGNNVLTYTNGTSGSVCVEVNENDPVAFTAPAGTYFNTVTFASYGLPSGGCGSYAVGSTCHSLTSQSVTEGRVLGNSNTITFRADNDTFGDPCYGTGKRYRGSASYSQPVCNGTDAGVISGSAPTGPGSYTYRWESSTTGASGSFTPIASSNVQNYSPGILTQTTYFRRVVTSSGCTSISPVILIRVNVRPTSVVSGTRTICNGESTTVSVALTGTAPWNISYTYGATSGTFTTSTNPYTASVSPSTTTTYAITALSDANCSAVAAGMTGNAVITVKQIQGTPTILDKTNIDCAGLGTITLGNLTASGWTINQTGPGTATSTITGTGVSRQITGLAAGNYTFTVETPTTCVSAATGVQTISDNSSTTWTATGWSNGNPDSTKRIIINSNIGTPFPSGTPVVNGCALTINPGINVTVPKEVTLVITNAVTTSGQLTFESESSLMQTTDIANSGNIIYKRKITVRRMDLTYWSNPLTKVGGFTMHDLSPNTLLDKYYTYDTTLGWVSQLNGAWPMGKGIGYSIRAPQNFDPTTPADFTGEFIGVPNNGNVDVSVVSGKFNLIGNPYPSAISANAFITGNSGVGTVYFWTHNSLPVQSGAPGDTNFYYGSTDYAAYNLSGPAGAMLNGANFQGFIAAGQGFLAKPPAGGVIHFTNSMRRAGNNSQFYKNNNADDLERNRIWLSFTNTQGAYKQLLLGYIEGATDGIDIDYDATTMSSNSYVDFYTINESKKFTIQGRALPFVNTDVIPLGYKTTIAGEFTIAIEDADGFFDSQEVYLEDLTTGKIINLRTENYKFTTEIGTFTDRFKLRYTSKTLGNEEFEDLENSVVVSIKNKVLKINSSKEEIKEVSIYNVGAQLMYTKNNVNSSELVISNLNSSNQVLLVKVTLENGYSFNKKVLYSNL